MNKCTKYVINMIALYILCLLIILYRLYITYNENYMKATYEDFEICAGAYSSTLFLFKREIFFY